MSDYLDILKARRAPIVKDGSVHLPGSGYATQEADGKLTFADPLAQKIESDDSAMRHRFRISTPAVDRAGDVVLPRGCEGHLERYARNPQVFLNHASFDLPIAMSKSPTGELGVLVRDEDLVADAFFHGKTYESEKTYELIKLGYLNAASIGFRPLKATLLADSRPEGRREVLNFEYPGLCFQEWELLEWSVVGVPCNPEALDGMKSWLGKNTASDTPLHQALKAMLVEDGGKSVTVSVTAEPPKAAPAVTLREVPVTPVSEIKVETPFTDAEIDCALGALGAASATLRTKAEAETFVHTWSNTERKALEDRLAALEGRLAAGEVPAVGMKKKTPAVFVRDVAAGKQDPNRPELLGLPDIRQKDFYSCGAAASMAVARGFFGVGPETLDEWKEALGTTIERSTHPSAIVKYLDSLGLAVEEKFGMTVDDLRAAWLKGAPVICPVQDYGPDVPEEAEFDYGHYLAVVGVSLGYVFCQDSSDSNVTKESGTIDALGKIMVAQDDWEKAWHDRDADGNKFDKYGIVVYGKKADVAAKSDLDSAGVADQIPDFNQADDKPIKVAGAKALKKLHRMYTCAMEHCSAHGELVEHPKVKPFLDEHRDLMDATAKAVHKFGKKHYPDHFPDDSTGPDSNASKADPVDPPANGWSPELMAKLQDQVRKLGLAQASLAAAHYRMTGKRLS